jgi:hypothetical protein
MKVDLLVRYFSKKKNQKDSNALKNDFENLEFCNLWGLSLVTAEDFWFFCDLYLQFIAPINLWNKCIDLRLFLKCKEELFLRPLRSKDDRCWILRLRPRNFVIISESLAANLEKVRQTSVWQTVPKFWFIYLFFVPQRLTLVSNAKRKISKSNKSELWNRLSYRGLPYFFEVGSQTFRNDYKTSRSQPQNSTSIVLWPQWPQKWSFVIFQK